MGSRVQTLPLTEKYSLDGSTSKAMANLLPKDKFTTRFKQIVPKQLPTSNEIEAFEDEDMDDDNRVKQSANKHELEGNDLKASVSSRNPQIIQNYQEFPDEDNVAVRDDFFDDDYGYRTSSPDTYFAQTYNDGDTNLPPPPPEDELRVNFSFDEALSSYHQNRENLDSSLAPSPLPPKLSVPSKSPPLPPSEAKPVHTKIAPSKTNISRKDSLLTNRINPPSSHPLIQPSKVSAKSSTMHLEKTISKDFTIDNQTKENWGNIASLIACKPQLKKTSENRNDR